MTIALAPQYTQRNYTWTAWKAMYATKGSLFQYDDNTILYTIWSYDGPDVHVCQIYKGILPYAVVDSGYSQATNDADKADFEANYKAAGNQPLYQSDTDGAQIVRNKAAKKGWTFATIPVEFATSRLQSDSSFYSKLADGTDRTGLTYKIYNGSDNEITTPGLAGINYASAVKSVLDFEPAYDYEIIGGTLRTLNDITTDLRLWIIGVPDIPAGSGGSKEMAGGLNLNYLVPQNTFAVDGRVSKFLTYNASLHTNKLRVILKYPAGTMENIQVVFELFKQ